MRRHEAYQALKNGKKVTHKSFTDDEHLDYVNHSIVTEDGYKFENRFWADDQFADGFELYESN